MNLCGEAGITDAKAGATYFGQYTSRLTNLSRPASSGTSPKLIRRVHQTDSTTEDAVGFPTSREALGGAKLVLRPRDSTTCRSGFSIVPPPHREPSAPFSDGELRR